MVREGEDLTREETATGTELEKRKFLGETREEGWTAGSLSRSMLMEEAPRTLEVGRLSYVAAFNTPKWCTAP